MFIKGVYPGILIIVFSFLLVKCSAQEENVVYAPEDYWKHEKPLQCYDCNSEYDPRCADPFNPYSIGIVNCSELRPPEHLINPEDHPNERLKPTVCRKIVQQVELRTRVIRECGYVRDDRDDRECAKRSGTKDIQIKYCACTTSLCNAGFNIRPSFSSLVVGLVFIIVYLGY